MQGTNSKKYSGIIRPILMYVVYTPQDISITKQLIGTNETLYGRWRQERLIL
jgi:hypothetical protein